MTITEAQIDLISRYKSSYCNGLTTQEAFQRRSSTEGLNSVDP
jgi:hypothetical protein